MRLHLGNHKAHSHLHCDERHPTQPPGLPTDPHSDFRSAPPLSRAASHRQSPILFSVLLGGSSPVILPLSLNHSTASICPAGPTLHALLAQHDWERAGGGRWGGECPWYVSGMPRATFFSARQRTPQPGASRSEAPWQRFLRHPGKFVVGDDLHPLGLRSAKYNLMTSPGSWFHLFSPQGKHPKEDQHQVLVTGSSPNPADECFFYQATTQSVPGLENPPTIMPQ